MSAATLDEAARAAGALAIALDFSADAVSVSGDPAPHGLPGADRLTRASQLHGAVAPGDRTQLSALERPGRVDLRVRILGEDGRVRYVRLIGRSAARRFTGLILPAGSVPVEASADVDREEVFSEGLKAGEVVAFHQPIIDLQTERLAGFEALARWTPPGQGVLGPDDFFPMAARMSLLGAIGETVRAGAIADLSAWRAARPGLKDLFVSANATASELADPGFADRLAAQIDASGLPRGAFKLEINETEVMRDPEGAEAVLLALKARGVALALDDFGTGYSSLARLDRLPFDVIKIDQYFVRAMLADGSAQAITASVIKLARSLGMVIVAEGVESEETADLLAEMGCDYAQGFHYAGALAPERAEAVLRSGKQGRFGSPR